MTDEWETVRIFARPAFVCHAFACPLLGSMQRRPLGLDGRRKPPFPQNRAGHGQTLLCGGTQNAVVPPKLQRAKSASTSQTMGYPTA